MSDHAGRRGGYAAVWMKDDGYYLARLSDHTSIVQQFKSGAAFVEFTGLFGDPCCIRGGQIEGISLITAESFAADRADLKEIEKEDAFP